MEASVAGFPWGWKQTFWDSRGDGKLFFGIPAGMWLYLTFMMHLCQRVNPPSTSFVCKTFGACLITIITLTETSASVNVRIYFISKAILRERVGMELNFLGGRGDGTEVLWGWVWFLSHAGLCFGYGRPS